MNQPKVLIFDIETSPITAYVWGLKDQNIGLNQIVKDWHVMAWGAKWLGAPASEVMYQASYTDNDKKVLKGLWKLLDEADIVITQNGKNFDSPKLNARFIHHGMQPPSPYKHLDTYLIVRNAAQFTSNKLEYLTEKLCTKYKKLSHSNFPGMSLWTECLKGNKKAWQEMKTYNIHDVLSTEEFYNKIKAWAPASAPDVFVGELCGVCGGHTHKKGFERTKASLFQRLHCQNCGKWSRGAKIKGDKKK